LVFALIVGAGAAGESADEILTASGVKGGLVVHLGCGKGELIAALGKRGPFLAHGLDTDAENVAAARERITEADVCGKASAEQRRGERLPYTDNLVNLVIVSGAGCRVSGKEIERVLAPRGILIVSAKAEFPSPKLPPLATRHSPAAAEPSSEDGTLDTGWKAFRKPVPSETDEWTHYLGRPDNNAVAHDMAVGKPRHMQWVAGPRFARSHEHLATVSAVVSSGGRVFTIIDEGPTESVTLPSKWFLVARDAFNGVLLWKKPIALWETQLRGFRSGPAHLPRRLVAVDQRVYVTLGYTQPVCELDAATGEVLQTYAGTEGASEILLADGALYVVKGHVDREEAAKAMKEGKPSPPVRKKGLIVLSAADGEKLWEKSGPETGELMPLTLAVSGNRLVFHNPKAFICLDAKTGHEQWSIPCPLETKRKAWSSPTVVIHEDIVLSADRRAPKAPGEEVSWIVSIGGGGTPGELAAYSLKNGKKLWSAPCDQIYNAPPDVFVINGEVWSGRLRTTRDPGYTEIRDVRTGEVKRTFPADPNRQVGMPHHRCYRNRATPRYILAGRAGIEYVSVKDGSTVPHNWVRGACQFGVMPANGLVYAPQHSCACYPKAKLSGFNALAAQRGDAPASHDGRLEKGPAYGAPNPQSAIRDPQSDWPVFRHDNARSGVASCTVPAGVNPAWQTDLSGSLCAPVAAGGKLYVAGVDSHTLYALDASTGGRHWAYTTGGRIDSPPTIAGGRVLFGSRDGYVYSLSSSDGKLVWRFRAGPEERRCVAFGQLESVHAVHGSVLEQDGTVVFASGISSYMEGGIRIYRLDAATGKQISVTCINDWNPKTGLHPKGGGFDIEGSLPDILSTDGENLFMRHRMFDKEGTPKSGGHVHLFSPAGFLDSTWWHRTYWVYGPTFGSGWGGWHRVGSTVPSGRILVVADKDVYGFGRSVFPSGNAGQWNKGEHYRFFAASKTPAKPKPAAGPAAKGGKKKRGPGSKVAYRWEKRLPLQCRAMVLAGETLFVAGPPDKLEGGTSEHRGPAALGHTGNMFALAAKDGAKLAEYPLSAAPVFDGLIAANGKLYVATVDGKVQCFCE